jgi:error-prone DNA polymerase
MAASECAAMPYAELHCLSNFSFQRGASTAQELFERARKLGYRALAITDECSMAGIVRAHEAANEHGLALIVGSEFRLQCGLKLVLLATDHDGYSAICRLITQARRSADKGEYRLTRADFPEVVDGVVALWVGGEAEGTRARGHEGTRKAVGQNPEGSVSAASTCPRALVPSCPPATLADAHWIASHFPARAWIAVELHQRPDDGERLAYLRMLSLATGLPLVAAGDVHMHERGRRALQDVLTAVRHRLGVREAGYRLQPNGERHLRSLAALNRLYPQDLLDESIHISQLCRFSLNDLKYQYPHEVVPDGRSASEHLRELTEAGIRERWPRGETPAVRTQIEYELALIGELRYESYFLTVHDIVRFARSRQILCQGRGSAANSAVCYALGVTEVDPARGNLLFERFISRERNEPPDIDVDFEHERREEVIQYLYAKYGRERAALTATVACYRAKSAIRDVGKALGLALDQVDQIASSLAWWDGFSAIEERLTERGFDPASTQIRKLLKLVSQLLGFPRHLSQHVGGFVISERPLHELVPVENAAMPDRTIIQWDKDDLDTLGLLKVDCLALGMLSCIRRCLELVNGWEKRESGIGNRESEKPLARTPVPASPRTALPIPHSPFPIPDNGRESGKLPTRTPDSESPQSALPIPHSRFPIPDLPPPLTLSSIPAEDPTTYAMLQAGDTVGVFQVESRAQMSMLPRLKPGNFYDLVIEVAIVRPGPIQGKMVHPYLRRRQGLEPVSYPSEDLKRVFERTLGVPIFQEQVMQLAIVAAGFTPGEADQLRRSMAAWKRRGGMEHYRQRIIEGMTERGYETAFAEQVFEQIKGFGSYGFPESHAASFALLVYASAWLKCHHPAAFAAALLNAQPLGFYSVSQIIQDARRHGVEVRPVDVRFSGWEAGMEAHNERSREARIGEWGIGNGESGKPPASTLASAPPRIALSIPDSRFPIPALRLGMREIRGLNADAAERLVAARQTAPFRDVQDLADRADLDRATLERLGAAGALRGLAGHRHRAQWAVTGVERMPDLFDGARIADEPVVLRPPTAAENVLADYKTTGLTLGTHPLKLLRPQLRARRMRTIAEAQALAHGTPARVAGLVTLRQRPGTASGVTFVTLEDESGWLNLIVWRDLAERQRRILLESQMLGVVGELQKADGVVHVLAHRLENLDKLLDGLDTRSRDFH